MQAGLLKWAQVLRCVCRLKLELPGIGARKPAEVLRPQLSTAVIAVVLLAAAAVTVWTKLPHA